MPQGAESTDVAIQLGRDCACLNLRKAARAVTQFYEDVGRTTGLRAAQFGILMGIRALAPTTITRLAKALVMDRTTLTRNLKLLEKRGLVQVKPGEDRRERKVFLTEQGSRALLEAIPFREKAQAHMVQKLGNERFKRLLSDLSAVIAIAHRN